MKMLNETLHFLGRALLEPIKLLSAFISDLPNYMAKNRVRLKHQGNLMLYQFTHLAETNYKLGLLHLRRGNISDAIMRFRLTLWLKPGQALAYYQLGRCYLMDERKEKAFRMLQQALAIDPNCQEAQFMIAAIEAKTFPMVIPASIIEEHYTVLAPQYDMVAAEYDDQSAAHVAREIVAYTVEKDKSLEVLDLGCGTGLVGQAVKEQLPHAVLVGVDINEEMLARAKMKLFQGRPIYRQLLCEDMHRYMTESIAEFEVIIASLSLHFAKDLTSIFAAIVKRLRPGGILVATVYKTSEKAVTMPSTFEYFVFPESVLRQQLEKSGFKELKLQEVAIRINQRGWLITATRAKK